MVQHAEDVLGVSGLDGTILLPRPSSKAVRKPNAVLAIRHALIEQPRGTAWLVATGTLTNVALLFATFPELVEHIRGLSIMGGAIGGGFTDAPMGHVKGEGERFGNWTRWAEFNIYVRSNLGSLALTTRDELCLICLSSVIPKLQDQYSRTGRLQLRRPWYRWTSPIRS